MSSGNTETRILQMQLENKDFEDGVRQTIKSLESLEEKLNLKNAGDGFQRVSAAANSVQMSHLESGIDAVTNKFTLMGQVGLQVLERVSNKIVDTSEKILRAATIQPMIDGWGEFEMKTGSIQTILGGIRKDFDDQPTAIHAISDALDELNEYADKTIYNFAQMTENVGKFTNQGLDLKTSTNAIKGIANWAAAVGADPAQMSRAMYNISQSLGAGSMQLIDWRSIRFANMATPEVKKLFAEVAKKVNPGAFDKNGKVRVSKKQTVDVLKDFETSLKAGWLTNDVMAEAFGIYAKAFSKEDLIAKYGEELGKQFYEMGEYAEEAATKVRTFTQLIGVLKEGLGSGWAQSFDIILGGFEKQTEFLTAIKDSIEEITNFQTEDRNSWLQAFSDIGGIDAFQKSILNTLDILKDFYWVFNDVISLVVNPFGWTSFNMTDGIFGPKQVGYTEMKSTWYGVKQIFDDINRTMENFRKWMYKPNDKTGRSPIHNLANALSGVAGAAGIAWQVLTGFGKFVFRIFKRFEPLVSAVLDLVGQIGGAIYNVFFNLTGQQTVEKIFDRIEGAIGPVVDIVVGLATAVVDLIHSFLGIDKAADDWTVLGDRMKAFWKIFEYNKELSFADNLKNSLKNALVAVFGKDTADSLIKAWDENIAPVLEQISNFFTQAFADLNRVISGLQSAAAADYSNADGVKGGAQTFLESFLKGYYGEDAKGAEAAYTNILGIYQEIEQYYNDNVKPHVDSLVRIFTEDLPAVNDKIAEFLFGPKSVVADYNGQHLTSHYGNRSGGLFGSIADAFKPENLDSIVKEVEDAWEKFNTVLFGPKSVVANYNGQHLTSHYERNGGIFGSITEFFNSETWAKDWALIEDAFNSVSNWITTKGQQAWKIIMDFLFGPEVVVADRNGQNLTSHYERQGGAYEAAISFLTPVWEWLESTGKKLYEYITTHDFQQMWDGLNRLLFGYDEIVAERNGPNLTSKMVHQGGVLTPVVEMLKPIAEVFEQIKGWALEKIGGIDFGKIWESIGRFFTGYDEVVANVGKGPNLTSSIVHHDGVFERIANFFDRIIAWYNEHKGTFDKIFGWIGGLGETVWGAFDDLFSGKGLGGFGAIGDYLMGGAKSVLAKLFPGNDMLNTGDGKQGETGGGFDLIGMITSLLFGSASADEVEQETSERSQAIVATLDRSMQETGGIGDALSKIPEQLQGLVAPVLAIFGVSAINKLLTMVTGREKTTFFDKLIALFQAIGEIFKGMGILVAGVAIGEKISPDAMTKAFGGVKDLLWNIVAMMALVGGASWGLDLLGDAAEAKIAKGFTNMKPNQMTSMSDNIAKFGGAFKDFMEGVAALIDDVEKIAIFGNVLNLEEGAKRVATLVGTVFNELLPVLGKEAGLSALSNAFNTMVTGWTDSALTKGLTADQKTKVATDTFSSTMAGLGALFVSVADGISSILSVTSILVPLISNDKFNNIITLIKTVGDVMTSVVGSLDILAGIKTVGKGLDTISIFGLNSKNAAGFLSKNPSQGGVAFLTAIKGIGVATVAVAALELLVGLGMFILDNQIDSWAKTVYRAMALVKNTLNMINTISPETTSSAQQIVETSGGVLATVAQWSWSGDPIKNAETFRQMGISLAIGLEALDRAVNSYQSGKILETFKDLNEAWAYIRFDDGGDFNVADFQGKISFLERAGQGFESMAQSFRGVTQTDVDNLGIVKSYASELNTISSILASISAFNAFTGFNGKSFVETLLEMSRVGHVIRDEAGNVQGLEELDGSKIKGYFNEILMALPDDPQLLRKLDAFTAAGGSNLGLFASGLLSLNEALAGYRDIMYTLDDDRFLSDTNVLGSIDKLGQKLTDDYDFLSQNTAQNMNTRLGVFATDLRTLAESFGILASSSRDMNGNDYSLKPIEDLLNSINTLGSYVDKNGYYVSISEGLSGFATQLATITSSVEGLISTIHGFGFNTADLKPVGDFLVQVAGIEQILTGYADIQKKFNESLTASGSHDTIEYETQAMDFVSKSKLWMNDFVPLMSILGQGIHDLWEPISGDGINFSSLNGAGTFMESIAGAMNGLKVMSSDEVNGYATALGNLKKSIVMGEANTIADDIEKIFSQIKDKEVQVKITPVFDSASTSFQLPENLQLGNNYGRYITMQLNMNDVQNVHVDSSQIESIVTKIGNVEGKIESLANSISQIKIQLPPINYSGSGPVARKQSLYSSIANYITVP